MAILHMHRREILFLQRARVHMEDGRIVYSIASNDGADDKEYLVRRWNIPTLNCSILILGQGSSVTQAAMRMFHDDQVMVAFAGTGATPFLMASQSYRPGARLQKWAWLWFHPEWRLWASKKIQLHRVEAVRNTWALYKNEGYFKGDPTKAIETYVPKIADAKSVTQLMAFEGEFVKNLYGIASRATGIQWNSRNPGEGRDRINRNLDHGNYIAYGIASIALWAYGIPFSMPVTHGATRNGGLVFDIADAFKDAVILPSSAVHASKANDTGLRMELIERLHGAKSLDTRNGAIGFSFKVIDSLFPNEDDCREFMTQEQIEHYNIMIPEEYEVQDNGIPMLVLEEGQPIQ